MCRGLAELTRLRLISANGADVASTALPAAASNKTALGPIIGGPHTCLAAPHAVLCMRYDLATVLMHVQCFSCTCRALSSHTFVGLCGQPCALSQHGLFIML